MKRNKPEIKKLGTRNIVLGLNCSNKLKFSKEYSEKLIKQTVKNGIAYFHLAP